MVLFFVFSYGKLLYIVLINWGYTIMKKAVVMKVNENAKVLHSNLDVFELMNVIGENFVVAPITPKIHLHDFEEFPEGDYRYCMITEDPRIQSDSKENFKVNRGKGSIQSIKGNVIFAKMKEPDDLDDFDINDLQGMCPRELNAFFNWLGVHFLFSKTGQEVLNLKGLFEHIKIMSENDKEVYDKENVFVSI